MAGTVEMDIPRQIIQKELGLNEGIIWVGQPRPSIHAYNELVFSMFGMFWLSILLTGTPVDGYGFGYFFMVFVGVMMLLSPWFRYREARGTVYVVTNNRAFVFDLSKRKITKAYSRKEIEEVSFTDRKNGVGDVYFTRDNGWGREGFIGVVGAGKVASYLRELKAGSNQLTGRIS